METIFAQSSALGKSGVSIFRISGPNAKKALEHFGIKRNLRPKVVSLETLHSQKHDTIIDRAIVIYFAAPNSFTGEDVIEFQTHGSVAVAKMIIEELIQVDGFRFAEPGEFAKRGFLNGKFDLTAAEGLADLIEAETLMQHKQAIRQYSGEMHDVYSKWRASLLEIQALLEAYIDFPDEEIPNEVVENAKCQIQNMQICLKNALEDNRGGERLRNGILVAIIGEPNVGKSSLINYLTGRDVAIVSNIAGTTRDVIQTYIDIGGYPIILADTAGIHYGTTDTIEQEGIKRAINVAKNADIKIFMFDHDTILNPSSVLDEIIDENTIIVQNKIDVKDNLDKINFGFNSNILGISVKEKINMQELIKKIGQIAETIVRSNTNLITQERHRRQLELALKALTRCVLDGDIVLAAEDIRLATRHLSILIGKIDVDEILGEIFGKFCIGK